MSLKHSSTWQTQGFQQHTPEQLKRARDIGAGVANSIKAKQDAYLARRNCKVTLATLHFMRERDDGI